MAPPNAVWLRASARGDGIGLTILGQRAELGALVIHVLPKMWRQPAGAARLFLAPDQGGVLTVHEGDYVAFGPHWQNTVLNQLVGPDGPDGSEEDSSALASSAVASGSSDPGRTDPLWTRAIPPPRAPVDVAAMMQPVSSMWALLLSLRLAPVAVPQSVLPSVSGAPVLAHRPELRPLLQATFVAKALELIPQRRPQYRSERASLATVRGRLLVSSLARREATQSMRVECEFDELARDHEAWQVVRTALEQCLATPGHEEAALAAVRQLSDVRALSVREAIAAARLIPPGFRGNQLAQLGTLALAILSENTALATGAGSGAGVIANIKYCTSGLWEELIALAFRHADCTVAVQSQMHLIFSRTPSQTWRSRSAKKPDLVIHPRHGEAFIVDAKYTQPRAFEQADMGHQYQAIAYALRTGLPTLLGFAKTAEAQGELAANSLQLRALPPQGFGLARDRVETIDSGWTLVGATSFPFPDPESAFSAERWLPPLVTEAHAVVNAISRAVAQAKGPESQEIPGLNV